MDLGNTIILDNGTAAIKAGFHIDNVPSVIIPSVAPGVTALSDPARAVVGGRIVDFDALEQCWETVFRHLNVTTYEHPVLVVDPCYPSRIVREKTSALLFEKFNVAAVHFASATMLATFAVGHTSAFVLDCGDGTSSAVAVVEGCTHMHSYATTSFAGELVSKALGSFIAEAGISMPSLGHLRTMKELALRQDTRDDDSGKNVSDRLLRLPDGSSFSLSQPRCDILSRMLVDRSALAKLPANVHDPLWMSDPTLPETLALSYRALSVPLRSRIPSVVLCGGASLPFSVSSALESSVAALPVKIGPSDDLENPGISELRFEAPSNRAFLSWKGASVLANLQSGKDQTMSSLWVTKLEYDENGPTFCRRKTL